MKKRKAALVAIVLAASLGWGWRHFFPNPEKVIRDRLAAIAQRTSFRGSEEPMARLMNVNQLVEFFSEEVRISVAIEGYPERSLDGRSGLQQAAMAARSVLSGLEVDFVDVGVEVGADRQTATANMTLKARVPGEKDLTVQELKMTLRKVKGAWLVDGVETVRTLTLPGAP